MRFLVSLVVFLAGCGSLFAQDPNVPVKSDYDKCMQDLDSTACIGIALTKAHECDSIASDTPEGNNRKLTCLRSAMFLQDMAMASAQYRLAVKQYGSASVQAVQVKARIDKIRQNIKNPNGPGF
jgi:hypothetical protein